MTADSSAIRRRRARLSDPDTSWSAQRPSDRKVSLRARVLGLHRANPGGLTDDELCAALPLEWPPSVGRSRSHLAAAGLVADSGDRRRTRRGSPANVWRLTEEGRA